MLLHGRGTDEHDLFPLLDLLDPERRLVGFTPRAPLTLPPGGYHWYISREVGRPDPDTFRSTFDAGGRTGSTSFPTPPACRGSGPCSAASRRAP